MNKTQKFDKRTLIYPMIIFISLFFFAELVSAEYTFVTSINSISTSQIEKNSQFIVQAFLTVNETNGNPVTRLEKSSFLVKEDGLPVEFTVREDTDIPLNIIIVVDTSGSMVGLNMANSKTALVNFISKLDASDQVALISFNNEVTIENGFTTTHQNITSKVTEIGAIKNTGSCIYDATYEAVELANSVPTGRRAIILISDGKDTLYSDIPCSTYSEADLLDFATDASTQVPIFTFGLGNEIDRQSLEKIALRTGGTFTPASNPSDINSQLQLIFDQLNNQYEVEYVSNSAPGQHSLYVGVTKNSATSDDTATFILPELKTSISFLYPNHYDEITENLTPLLRVIDSSGDISFVQYFLGDELIGQSNHYPFSKELDIHGLERGEYSLKAVAFNSHETEISTDTLTIVVNIPADKNPTQTAANPDSNSTSNDKDANPNNSSLIIFVSGIAGAALAISLVVVILSFKKSKEKKQKFEAIAFNTPDLTMDDVSLDPSGMAHLTVLASDEPTRLGERFALKGYPVRIGRKGDNDWSFTMDQAVSRHHALIEYSHEGYVISEVTVIQPDGTIKKPTYGTFVNDADLSGQKRILASGDQIRLGRKVLLLFEMPTPPLKFDQDGTNSLDDRQDEKNG